MEFNIKDGALTLYLAGDINSNTSERVGKEIEETLEGKTFDNLVLDFRDVVYVSSAGLRIMLRCKQKYPSVSIINVSMDVYDVFQMTGFTSIMPISRALARVEVDESQIVGEGYTATVYRINKDTIIKVFKSIKDVDEIEREMALAREAFILGIPTAITFDVVQVGDKYGVRFEMLDSISLRDAYRDYPEEFENLCKDYAKLLKSINTAVTQNPNIPSCKQHYVEKLKLVLPQLDKDAADKVQRLIEAIPETRTFVHGDCHVKNILCQNHELFLIDMDTLSVGDPVFEFAGIYACYNAFEEVEPGNSEFFLGLKDELVKRLFHRIVELYFGKWDEEAWKKIQTTAYIHMIWWALTYDPENAKLLTIMKKRLLECLPEVEDLSLAK